ncbi:hypothetical protein AO071_17810 [Pseudomonas syringae]|uniref:Uncharacterized protein n=1 Tax=Pseudomonas syringae pv. japonica str. M301072 TaxID=629262 RepID=F3FN76_PSESX|nr:hypothetical protein PSYJA_22878 [Pseudomonas syringae pv. japonica str. M301072]PHN76679.1 hypothetical protein AO071_17810 [Pseudomonas syringae]
MGLTLKMNWIETRYVTTAFWFGSMVAMSLLAVVGGMQGNVVAVIFGVISASCGAFLFMLAFVEAMAAKHTQVTPGDKATIAKTAQAQPAD